MNKNQKTCFFLTDLPGDEEWESTEKRLGEKGKEFFVAMAEIKAKAKEAKAS